MKIKRKKVILIVLLIIGGLFAISVYYLPYIISLKVYDSTGKYQYRVYGEYAVFENYLGADSNIVIADKILGRKVTQIKRHVFKNNTTILSVQFPDYLQEVGEVAFKNCTNLNSVVMNNGLKVIGANSFEGCSSLKKIIIPESVELIDVLAFVDSGVEEIKFETVISQINCMAFRGTPWLDKQDGFVICGDSVLIDYQGEEEVVIVPAGVKVLSNSFYDDEEIKKVYLPNSVEKIMYGSFLDCKNITVYIPDSVKDISSLQIKNAGKLTIVTTAGSYAESFAKENDIEYEIVDEIIYPEAN